MIISQTKENKKENILYKKVLIQVMLSLKFNLIHKKHSQSFTEIMDFLVSKTKSFIKSIGKTVNLIKLSKVSS